MRYWISFIITFLLSGSTVFGQKIFREAYIIKHGGEKLNGLVAYVPGQKIPSYCVFKRFQIAAEIKYRPSDIKEFGFKNGSSYLSYKTEKGNIFIESIVRGILSLYSDGENYYLGKNNSGIIPLNDFPMRLRSDDSGKIYNNITELLKDLTDGKIEDLPSVIKKSQDIVPVVIAYNKSVGSDYKVQSKNNKPEPDNYDFFSPGKVRNKFGIAGGINGYKLIIKSLNKLYPTGPQETEYAAIGGITYERVLSRKNNTLALRTEMLFLKQNFYSFGESLSELGSGNIMNYDDWLFEFTGIKVPVMIKYTYKPDNYITPFITGGVAFTNTLKTGYYHRRETAYISNYQTKIFTSEDNIAKISRLMISPGIGAGFSINLPGTGKLQFTGRIEAETGLLRAPNKHYDIDKQISLLNTFMVGISF